MYLQKVKSKKNLEKNLFFVDTSRKPLMKRAEPGFLTQWYGSEDPDSYQNVTDPQQWVL